MATLVSDRNQCKHCIASHTPIASSKLGYDVVASAVSDPEHAPLDEGLARTLAVLETLTVRPTELGTADIERLRRANVDEQAISDAVAVCVLFDLTNRIADGVGCESIAPLYSARAKRMYGRIVLLTGYTIWGLLARPRLTRIDRIRGFGHHFAMLRTDALESEGELDPDVRLAAESRSWSITMDQAGTDHSLSIATLKLVDKIATSAPDVSGDDHAACADDGLSPRATYELIVAASMGAARARWEIAFALLSQDESLPRRS
jgi:alkylhydroperoxidase family enzyme